MSIQINRKTTEDTLTSKFEKDGKLLGDVSSLFAFAAVAISGEPVSLAVGLALIVKTAGSAIKAGANIVERLAGTGMQETVADLAPYDRFRVLFYVT